MIVVADTSPINYLLLIDKADLLPRLFGEVWVPDTVVLELRNPRSPPQVRDWGANPPAWLRIMTPSSRLLIGGLNAGESQAITLALDLGAGRVLIDERLGRAEARRRGLVVTGTLGVLMAGAKVGLIDPQTSLERLRSTNFRASERQFHQLWPGDAGPGAPDR